jgi:UDP-glucose 4-epimerase
MSAVLVTGSAGFFGGVLRDRLLAEGADVVGVDLEPDVTRHPRLRSVQGDIGDRRLMNELFATYRFERVFHCAAILAHAVKDKRRLWAANVDGTRLVADCAARHGTRSLVFISSNCLWGHGMGHPVREDDPPAPVEIYGRSKAAAENILAAYRDAFALTILRSPTIVDEGRLGLLSILFDFIREGRRVWMVGQGANRYQFVYAPDLADACLRAAGAETLGTFHVGAHAVRPLRDVFQHVIDKAGSGARLVSLSRGPALTGMRLVYALGLSPFGPYQYKMIAEDFVFDTGKIEASLGWRPTLTNEEMLWRAYRYYDTRIAEIRARRQVSAHRRPAAMGAIRMLKWLS